MEYKLIQRACILPRSALPHSSMLFLQECRRGVAGSGPQPIAGGTRRLANSKCAGGSCVADADVGSGRWSARGERARTGTKKGGGESIAKEGKQSILLRQLLTIGLI